MLESLHPRCFVLPAKDWLSITTSELRPRLNAAISFKSQSNPSVLRPAQIHDQTIPMGYRMGITMKSLKGLGVEESVAPAQVEEPVYGA